MRKSDRCNKYILVDSGQNPDVYDFLVFYNIFIPIYKDLSALMLVQNTYFICTKFSEILKTKKKCELQKNEIQRHLQFTRALPEKATLGVRAGG